jgi:hypothetical protein
LTAWKPFLAAAGSSLQSLRLESSLITGNTPILYGFQSMVHRKQQKYIADR